MAAQHPQPASRRLRRRRGRRRRRRAARRPDGGRRRRARRDRLAQAARESSSFWAQGGLAAAIGADDSPELPRRRTRSRPAATPAAARPPRCWPTRRPGWSRSSSAAASSSTATPTASLALALEGGHSRRRIVHAGGAGTGRRDHRAAGRAGCRGRADRGDRGRLGGRAVERRRALPRRDHRRAARCRRGPPILATGGAAALWAPHDQPWGAIGAGPVIAHAAGAELADLELCQFHPDRARRARDPLRRLAGDRGGARRGRARCSTPHGRRFTDELAPRDEVTARGPRADGAPTAPTTCCSTCAGSSRGALPERLRGTAPRPGFDPAREPVPVSPASHYLMGGVATDLEGRSTLPRPLRGRRVRLHRSARRQPARLELAHRVLRARRAGRRGGGGTRRRRPAGTSSSLRRPTGASTRRRPRPATRSGSSPGPAAKRRRARAAARRPVSARPPDRPLRADARGVARLAPAPGVPRTATPSSTGGICSAAARPFAGKPGGRPGAVERASRHRRQAASTQNCLILA